MRKSRDDEYVLAFDFSLDRLDMALMAPNGDWIIPHQAYTNNRPGFRQLKKDVLAHLSGLDQARLTAAGESTAVFGGTPSTKSPPTPTSHPSSPPLLSSTPSTSSTSARPCPKRIRWTPKMVA